MLIGNILYDGIRLSALNVKESDVDLVAGELRVIGKRNKERIIPLDKLLCEKISIYRQEGRICRRGSYLFVREKWNEDVSQISFQYYPQVDVRSTRHKSVPMFYGIVLPLLCWMAVRYQCSEGIVGT